MRAWQSVSDLLRTALLTGLTVSFSARTMSEPPAINEAGSAAPSRPEDIAGSTPPKLLKGRLRFSDLPGRLRIPGMVYSVIVNYEVGLEGIPSDCRAVKSSGDARLDDKTCKLIEKRFRYLPAKDVAGHDMSARIVEPHVWTVKRRGP